MNTKTLKILILGGGYGGLKCAISLQKNLSKSFIRQRNIEITLISKHDYHYQTTLLHKVSIGTYSTTKARIFYRTILDPSKIIFRKDDVSKIDIETKTIHCKYSCYKYDYLIVALGFTPNTFGIKGADIYTHKIETLNAANRICKDIEHKFKDFSISQNALDLSFIICGSGFTGVEFAAELAKQAKWLSKVCGIDPNIVKVYLIGRGEHILPMFNTKLSAKAEEKLKMLGITIINGTVIECKKDGILLEKDGEIREILGNTTIWSAGVKGSEVIKNSNIENIEDNRVLVDKFLNMHNHKEIFVIGDSAKSSQRDVFHAPTAQLANQMGEYVAMRLIKILNHIEHNQEFCFKSKGTVCSIAHTDAVGVVMGFNLSGEIAAFFKNVIENKWIFSIGGLINVIKKGQFRLRSSN